MKENNMKNSIQEKPGVWEGLKDRLGVIGFNPLGLCLIIILAFLPYIPPFNKEHILRWLIMGALFAAQAIAFDFTAGFINVVNFGFAAILGVGAYSSAILTNTSPVLALQPGLSPWIGIFAGGIVSGLLGLGLGIVTLRSRGTFAGIMCWFVGLALIGLMRNLTGLTRGPAGMAPAQLFNTSSNIPYYYVIIIMMLVVYITLKLVTRSHIGLALRAIGQNWDAARASGINPTYYRVFNFTLSAFFAGWLGGFYAHYFSSLTPESVMHTSKTVEVLAIAYIGGRGSLWGGMVVAFPFIFFVEFIRSTWSELPGLHLVIYGLLMIVVMIFYPQGVSGIYYAIREKISKWLLKGKAEV